MKQIAFLAAATCLALSACSPAPDKDTPQPAEHRGADAPVATAPVPAKNELTLAGLADLKIGEAAPEGSDWQARGAPVGNGCSTARSADFPGIYALIEDGKVRRITAGEGSTVKLAGGISVGASEAAAKARFPTFAEEPHKYEEAPAKYLMTPDLKPGVTGVRLEIKADGKVGLIHVGQLPVLAYVEGCG